MPFKDQEKRNEYNKKYYAQNQEKILEQKRSLKCDAFRKKKREQDKAYRATEKGRFIRTRASKIMSFEAFVEMKERQKNLCAICGNKCTSGRNLAIDHCHKRNIVRGLLCGSCNLGIGKFKDDVSLLKQAIEYIKRYETSE